MFHASCVFYLPVFLQSSASKSRSHLDENMHSFLVLLRYMHLSHVNNGVVVVVPRVRALLAVNGSTMYRAPRFYPLTIRKRKNRKIETIYAALKRGECTLTDTWLSEGKKKDVVAIIAIAAMAVSCNRCEYNHTVSALMEQLTPLLKKLMRQMHPSLLK
jgi:hypothetical protein